MTASPSQQVTIPSHCSLVSDLPGRIRLRSEQLVDSADLRRHCRLTLYSCLWLESFRINPLSGSLSAPRWHQHRDRSCPYRASR